MQFETHKEPHPLAGKEVNVIDGPHKGEIIRIENWDTLIDRPPGNPTPPWFLRPMQVHAEMNFFKEQQERNFPMDNEVIYGKVGGLGYLMHTSDLGEPVA